MRPPARRGGWSWRTYWASLALLSTVLGLWGLATPMFAVPDEPAHFLKAAAVVRAQWIGPPGERTLVRVPPGIAAAQRQPGCFAFQGTVSAACAPTRTASGPGRRPQPPGSAPLLAGAFCLAAAAWSAWLLRLAVSDHTDLACSDRSAS